MGYGCNGLNRPRIVAGVSIVCWALAIAFGRTMVGPTVTGED